MNSQNVSITTRIDYSGCIMNNMPICIFIGIGIPYSIYSHCKSLKENGINNTISSLAILC